MTMLREHQVVQHEHPMYTVDGAFRGWGLICFFGGFSGLLVLTLFFRFCVAGNRTERCMAVFLDAGEEVEEDDGAPAPVEEKIKEGEQQGTSKASDEEPLLHEHRPEQAELAARRSKKYLLQVGYRTHWLGDLLYAFWALLPVLLQIFLLVICFCLLDGDRKGMGRWLWLTNRVFNLNFCTREMISMVAEVDNEDHQDLLSTTTDYHFCNARTGPTSGPFHFRNLGLVFLLFWGLFLGVAFLLLSPKLRFRLFFMVPEELRNCDLVVVEEWEEKDSSSRGAARKGCTSKDDHLNHSKGSNAGTSTSTTSSGEPHPPTNTDTSKIVARLFANSRYFKTQQVGNYLYIKRLAYSTPASEMTVQDRAELEQYFSTVNKTIDSPRFFRFRCVRFLYCPVRNVFVEPENEFLDNGLMTTKDVIEVYRDFLQGGRCSVQGDHDVINETVPGSSHIGDGDVGAVGTTTFNRTSTSKSAVGKKLPNSRFLSTKKYDIHGSNVISVDGNADSLFHFLKLEFLDFATVFQMHCLWAPSIFSNWMLAVINIALCLLFGVINAYNTRNNYKEMEQMACTSGTDLVNVFRYNRRRRSCGSRTQEGRPGEDDVDEQLKFSGRTTTTPRPVGGSLSRRSRGTTTTVTRKLRSSCDSGRGGSPLPEKLRGKLSSRRFSILEEVESFYSAHFDIATTQVAKLVPGDLIEINGDSNSVIPCDCVVLQGSVVVNESNLTGEAMPIQKFALEATNEQMCLHKHGKKNIVYAGTTVMSSSRNGDSMSTAAMNNSNSTNKPPAVAVVLATGAQTAKGQMIRRILYAPDVRFELYDTLPRAVMVYACVTLALLVGTVFGRPEWKQTLIAGFFDSVCAFSRLISPMVRVGFKIAQRNAARRMKAGEFGIQTLSGERIPVAGKLEVQCWDKTGTLTRESLNFYGVEGVWNEADMRDRLEEGSMPMSILQRKMAAGKDDAFLTVAAEQAEVHREGEGVLGQGPLDPSFSTVSSTPRQENGGVLLTVEKDAILFHGEAAEPSSGRSGVVVLEDLHNSGHRKQMTFALASPSTPIALVDLHSQLAIVPEQRQTQYREEEGPPTTTSWMPFTPLKRHDGSGRIASLLDLAACTCHTVMRLEGPDGKILAGNKVECELVKHYRVDFRPPAPDPAARRLVFSPVASPEAAEPLGGQHQQQPLLTGGSAAASSSAKHWQQEHARLPVSLSVSPPPTSTRIRETPQECKLQTASIGPATRPCLLEYRVNATDERVIARTLRQFEFDQKIQLQSVVVDVVDDALLGVENEDSQLYLFTKGSPAKVAARCVPSTLPVDFAEHIQRVARQGYYVLAVACKPLGRAVPPAAAAAAPPAAYNIRGGAPASSKPENENEIEESDSDLSPSISGRPDRGRVRSRDSARMPPSRSSPEDRLGRLRPHAYTADSCETAIFGPDLEEENLRAGYDLSAAPVLRETCLAAPTTSTTGPISSSSSSSSAIPGGNLDPFQSAATHNSHHEHAINLQHLAVPVGNLQGAASQTSTIASTRVTGSTSAPLSRQSSKNLLDILEIDDEFERADGAGGYGGGLLEPRRTTTEQAAGRARAVEGGSKNNFNNFKNAVDEQQRPTSSADDPPCFDSPREELEKELCFLGLLYFRNALKPCTASAIKELKQGGVQNVMVTGDNVWNGLHIGKKCGLVDDVDSQIVLVDIESTSSSESLGRDVVVWSRDDFSPGGECSSPTNMKEKIIDSVTLPLNAAHRPERFSGSSNASSNCCGSLKKTLSQTPGESSQAMLTIDKEMDYGRGLGGHDRQRKGNKQKQERQSDHSASQLGEEEVPIVVSVSRPEIRSGNRLTQEEVLALLQDEPAAEADRSSPTSPEGADNSSVVFAVTQAAFSFLQQSEPETLSKIFPKIAIFGSMNPSGKVEVVQRWAQTKVVGMCGDGGNDCAALKMAHVGMALVAPGRTTEVSIVSPFSASKANHTEVDQVNNDHHNTSSSEQEATSNEEDDAVVSIHSVVTLCKEGRCALENSVACYKFFIYFGLLSAISKMLLQPKLAYFSELHFFFQDAILLVLLTLALSNGRPHAKLATITPEANVLGAQVILDVLIPVVIQVCALLFTFWLLEKVHGVKSGGGVEDVDDQKWYSPADSYVMNTDLANWADMYSTFVSSLTGIWATISALTGAVLYSIGGRFRRTVLRNYLLVLIVLITVPLYAFLLFEANTGLNCVWRVNCDDASSWATEMGPFTWMLGNKSVKNRNFWWREVYQSSRLNHDDERSTSERMFLHVAEEFFVDAPPFADQKAIAAVGVECEYTRAELGKEVGVEIVTRTLGSAVGEAQGKNAEQCILEAPLKLSHASSQNRAAASTTCQNLCEATWSVGKPDDETETPLTRDTTNRFYCWWAAVGLEVGDRGLKNNYACYLSPRLDVYGRRTLGPDYPPFTRELEQLRLAGPSPEHENERLETSKFLAASATSHNSWSSSKIIATTEAGAQDEHNGPLAFRMAIENASAEQGKAIEVISLSHRNAHNILGVSSQEQDPVVSERSQEFALQFVATLVAAFVVSATASVFLVKRVRC